MCKFCSISRESIQKEWKLCTTISIFTLTEIDYHIITAMATNFDSKLSHIMVMWMLMCAENHWMMLHLNQYPIAFHIFDKNDVKVTSYLHDCLTFRMRYQNVFFQACSFRTNNPIINLFPYLTISQFLAISWKLSAKYRLWNLRIVVWLRFHVWWLCISKIYRQNGYN